MSEVTRILSAIEQGDPHAAEQLLPLVYDELRKFGAQKMTVALRKAKLGPDHPDTLRIMNDLAWRLSTYPDPKYRDSGRAVELARRAVELTAKDGSFWNTRGVAHYRIGDWKAAIQALEKSMELRHGGDSFDGFFLAMAHWQLGNSGVRDQELTSEQLAQHKEQARKWYDQAVEWMEKNKPQDEELKRFRAEAAELLGVKEASRE